MIDRPIDGAEVREHRFELGELSFNVAEAGSGPPVLLLHGFPDRWQLWRHQIAALAASGHQVIAPDLRGFGESDRPEEVDRYKMAHLVGDVLGLLDILGIERCAVVGHDWGAALTWTLAAVAPQRVDRLVAISVGHLQAFAAAGVAQRQRSWYMLWFLFPGVAEAALAADDFAFFRRWAWAGAEPGDDLDADRQVADLSRPGALTAALNWYRANIDPASFHLDRSPVALPAVTCPAMGVWSSHDLALTEQQMTGSERFVEGPWRYERLEGIGHWVPVQAPEQLSALLVDFLGD